MPKSKRYSLKVPVKNISSLFAKYSHDGGHQKKRPLRPIVEAIMRVGRGTEQTPAAIVKILKGIGVNAESINHRKALS